MYTCLSNAREERPALQEKRSAREWTNVERYAEGVAGAVLLPKHVLLEDQDISRRPKTVSWSIPDIGALARRYKVTPLAMITRLLRIGYCTPAVYKKWRTQWNEYLKLHPPKESGGIATPAQKAVSRNGRPYTRLVLEALTRERITSLDAAHYLNLGFSHVEILRRDLASGLPTHFRDEAGAT